MNILAVDTAGKTAGVALLQDDRLLYEVYLDGGMTHSETLMPMIDTCLKLCGLTCADIDLYAVNAGPGSFTGLRIGLAAVKGLAFPRETLCAPVSTLEALAAAHTGEGTVLCALDARRAQVYSAAFDLATHSRLLEDDARAVADLADFVENCKKPLFFVGGPARRACCCSGPCGKADGRSRKGCAAGGSAAGLPPPESGRAGARRAPCSRSCSQCRPKQGAGIKPCVTERKEHFHGKTHCTGR